VKPSQSGISAVKADGKVWVNTDSGIYFNSGQCYGKTKKGKFMKDAKKRLVTGPRKTKNSEVKLCIFSGPSSLDSSSA
jgi:hypothetical protein